MSLTLYKNNNSLSNKNPFNSFWGNLDSFWNDLDTLFSDRMHNHAYDAHLERIEPKEDHYSLQIGVPGLTSKDVDVELQGQYILVNYQDKSKKYLLPKDINLDKITASVKNGLLEIAMPKLEETKIKKRKITVS